jgi:hypothetical protein
MKKQALICFIIGVFLIFPTLSAQTWTQAERLTWTTRDSRYPAIAVDSSDNIHVVWSEKTSNPAIINPEIFYNKSTDGGMSWTTKRLTWNSGGSWTPAIAIDSSDNIHVVWHDNSTAYTDIFYLKSTDGGATWSSKRLTFNSSDSFSPSIAVDSNNHIHVVWDDFTPGTNDIYYKKSTDGGTTWSTKRLTWTSSNSHEPIIASDKNDNLHVVWTDYTPGNFEVFYKKSTDGGVSWSTKRLTWNMGGSWYPTIAFDSSGNIHLVWHDETPGNYEIYYKKSTTGGASWSTKRLTWSSGDSRETAIAIDPSDNIHVVWQDSTSSNNEIFYKRSTNSGTTWASKRLTWNPGSSEYSAVATDSNNRIHVVWQDETPGNWEIYYKKGIK